METFKFTPDFKTKGFSVEVPDGSLKTIEIQQSISEQYKKFLNSDVERSKNAGDNLVKVLIGLGAIAATYFSGKQILKNLNSKKITLNLLKEMNLEDAAKWIHDSDLSDLENICDSEEDIKELYELTIEAVTKVTAENLDWENWRETAKGFTEFMYKYDPANVDSKFK